MGRRQRDAREREQGADRHVLGVDIGRVITGEDPRTGASLLTQDWTRTPCQPGAFTYLRLLNSTTRFGGRVYLVSKAGPVVEARTWAWLELTNFHEVTGIPAERVTIVRERREKAGVCRVLGVTHFVDDRLSTLMSLDGIVPQRLLFSPVTPPQVPRGLIHVRSWAEAEPRLRLQ